MVKSLNAVACFATQGGAGGQRQGAGGLQADDSAASGRTRGAPAHGGWQPQGDVQARAGVRLRFRLHPPFHMLPVYAVFTSREFDLPPGQLKPVASGIYRPIHWPRTDSPVEAAAGAPAAAFFHPAKVSRCFKSNSKCACCQAAAERHVITRGHDCTLHRPVFVV